MRRDLPELVAHGRSRGLWMNLITNGIRCARPEFVQALAGAGLDSAQVSLEAGEGGAGLVVSVLFPPAPA